MQKGFSTLFIVIVLGSVALSLSIAFSTASLRSIQNSHTTKYEMQARGLVNSCAEIALEELKNNNSIVVSNQNFTINGNDCTYSISNSGGNLRQIDVSGTVRDVTKKILIETDSFNPLHVNLWNEIN